MRLHRTQKAAPVKRGRSATGKMCTGYLIQAALCFFLSDFQIIPHCFKRLPDAIH